MRSRGRVHNWMLVSIIMGDKYLPSPWQGLRIPSKFSQVIKIESSRTQIYGPFGVESEYRDTAELNLRKKWQENCDEIALYIEAFDTHNRGNWSWFSNRYHYFSPDFAHFEDNILTFVHCLSEGRYRHLFFRPLTSLEWETYLGHELPESMEARVALITQRYWQGPK